MENTVVNKMIQDCRIGMDKRRPVIWIKTSEMELVRRIVKSEQLVPNLRNTFKNGWAPLFEAENDRLIWGELSGNHNIKFASVEELKKYFNTSSIKPYIASVLKCSAFFALGPNDLSITPNLSCFKNIGVNVKIAFAILSTYF